MWYADKKFSRSISTDVNKFMLNMLLAITHYDIHANYKFIALHFKILTHTMIRYKIIKSIRSSIATTKLLQTWQCF